MTLKIPIIGISYNDSSGLENTIKHHFQDSFKSKISQYQKLGKREKITLDTLHNIFVRKEGCTISDVKHLLNELTLYGSIPEPIRICQLLAKALLLKNSSF